MFVSSYIQKPQAQTSRNVLHMLTVAVARFFSDDRAVSNARPVLWMTSCFHIIGQAKATPVGRILKVTQQVAALGAKSDVYDCLVCVLRY